MTVLRVLIVDDEQPARQRLQDLLRQAPDTTLVATCKNGQEAIEAILDLDPDLVFLDVQMPQLSGLDVLEAIGPERMPAVIFVTAYDKYALQAFEHAAVDYLLKPFDDDRFTTALARVRLRHTAEHVSEMREAMLELISSKRQAERGASPYPQRLAVKDGDAIRLVEIDRVRYVLAEGPYVELHLEGGASLLHRERMHALEKKLDPCRFCRIHRSTIVRIDQISALEPDGSGDYRVRLHDGGSLKVSRARLGELQARLDIH